jgi:transcriptional regulator with XRE-family HTH domain
MSYEINQRVLLLRKSLKLNQTEFGERIGVSRGVINNIDLSIVDIETKPLLIQQICKEYNVSRVWLETGEGDMFEGVERDAEIALRVGEILGEDDESFRKQVISLLVMSTEDEWRLFQRKAEQFAEIAKKAKEKKDE